MKQFVLLLAMMVVATWANAQKVQEKDVPAAVKSALQKQFAGVKNVSWEKEKGNYEAGFKHNAVDCSVLLSPSGAILETEEAIAVSTLPAVVKDYVSKNYPKQKIKEAAKITDARGIVTYEAEVNGTDLIFDNAGKFLKAVKD